MPNIRKDEDIVYSLNKYRETEGTKDTNDPTALFCGLISNNQKTIWVFDELYKKALTNEMIYKELEGMGYAKEKITADSAEPKSIEELRRLGLRRIKAAEKGRDSVANGIQKIQDFHIIIHPRCVNFLTEISCYSWEQDKSGKAINNLSMTTTI